MAYCYTAEVFYQIAKRSQRFPFAQLVGRTDFALFPVAGYLCAGYPDETAFLYFVFFYLFAEAHLGVNDLADLTNDLARRMQSVTVLLGKPGTAYWVAGFVFLHLAAAFFFLPPLGLIGIATLAAAAALLLLACARLLYDPSPAMALRVLPFFHATMVVYAAGIIVAVVW
jgi:4-hydroxybenzoate polyprenyltransferase